MRCEFLESHNLVGTDGPMQRCVGRASSVEGRSVVAGHTRLLLAAAFVTFASAYPGRAQTQPFSLAASVWDNISFADQFTGADACAKIANAISALPSTGGTVDARGFQGSQTCTTAVSVSGKSVKLILGHVSITTSQGWSFTNGAFDIEGAGAGASAITFTNSGAGITISAGTNQLCTLHGLAIYGSASGTAGVDWKCHYSEARNLFISNYTAGDGFLFDGVLGSTLSNSYITSNKNGVRLWGGTLSQSNNNTVKGSTIQNNSQWGIYDDPHTSGGLGVGNAGNAFLYNILENNGTNTSPCSSGTCGNLWSAGAAASSILGNGFWSEGQPSPPTYQIVLGYNVSPYIANLGTVVQGNFFSGAATQNDILLSSQNAQGQISGNTANGSETGFLSGATCSTVQMTCINNYVGGQAPTEYINPRGPLSIGNIGSLSLSNLLISSTAPTISSGFGTSPSIVASNGSAGFQVNVGTGGTASSGTIGLPAAAHGWTCSAADVTTQSSSAFLTKQTASTTTSATLTNYNTSGTATAWAASDKLNVQCFAF